MKPNIGEFEPTITPDDWSVVIANIDTANMPTDEAFEQLPAFVGLARDLFPEGVERNLAQQRPPYDGTPLVHTRILS